MDAEFLTDIPVGFKPYKHPKSFVSDLVKEAKKYQPQYIDNFGQNVLVNLNGKKANVNENIMITPYSISLALQLAASGSNSSTFSDFVKVLQIPNVGSAESLLKNQGMILGNEEKKKKSFTAAFSMWVNNKFGVYKSYVDSIQQAFNASIFVSDFSSSETVDEINSWVSKQTKKLIPSVVSNLQKDDNILLINTLYFKGRWEEEFKETATTTGNFTRVDGSIQRAYLMHASQKMDYFSDEYIQAVVLPFDKGLKLLVILPKGEGGIALDMVTKKYLVHDRISHILFNLFYRTVNMQLPRFNVTYSASLKETLVQLGLENPFTENADFAYISPQKLKISDVVHNVAFSINEEGAQIAASTSVKMEATKAKLPSTRADSLPFTVNRPFVYALLDEKTALFTGVVRDLGNEIVQKAPKIDTKEL